MRRAGLDVRLWMRSRSRRSRCFTTRTPSAHPGAAEIEKTAADYGWIVAKESYKTEDTDLTAQLTKIRARTRGAHRLGHQPGPALAPRT